VVNSSIEKSSAFRHMKLWLGDEKIYLKCGKMQNLGPLNQGFTVLILVKVLACKKAFHICRAKKLALPVFFATVMMLQAMHVLYRLYCTL
jgi:hypothetical protein